MENKAKITPKDVFLHLFNIIIFYLSVIGFIMLYVQYINVWFPDTLNFYFTGIADVVRVATSIFVIGAPVYLLTYWMIAKDFKANPYKMELSLRKWLTYFTLFISAITIIVDLVIFVYNFLNGELTARFFLKVLVVLIVAAAVFGFYLWELKRQTVKSNIPKILAGVIIAVVIISVVIGVILVGTPADQHSRRLDDTRIQDLQTLQNQVVNYWTQKQVLPAKLELLQDSISGFAIPVDPETKALYEYKVLKPLSFELCATFKNSSKDLPGSTVARNNFVAPYEPFKQNWDYQTGRTCFTRDIDPELYKQQNQKVPQVKN